MIRIVLMSPEDGSILGDPVYVTEVPFAGDALQSPDGTALLVIRRGFLSFNKEQLPDTPVAVVTVRKQERLL